MDAVVKIWEIMRFLASEEQAKSSCYVLPSNISRQKFVWTRDIGGCTYIMRVINFFSA